MHSKALNQRDYSCTNKINNEIELNEKSFEKQLEQ